MGTLAALLAVASVAIAPVSAAVGEEVVVEGPPGRAALLEPLDAGGRTAPLGTIGATGTLRASVPDVPHGSYRVIVAGEGEAPVLEVLPLSEDTSLLLLAFGVLLVLALFVAGVVVHRRWRDAVS